MNEYIFLFVVLVKIYFTLFCSVNNNGQFTSTIHFSHIQKGKVINDDENLIANIANSYRTGHGFCYHNGYSDTSYYEKTSYRSFQVIFIHVIYQKLYNKYIAPIRGNDFDFQGHYLLTYFLLYGKFLSLLSFLLTIISIPYFKKILDIIFLNKNDYIIYSILFLYVIFPSSLIYLGTIPMYENISVPSIVIIISILIQHLNGFHTKYSSLIAAILTGLVISIRPQTLLPFAFVYSYFVFVFIRSSWIQKKINVKILKLILCTLIVSLVSLGQTILINKQLWNKYVLSTRGDALFWGHNPLAKGSWDPSIDTPGSKFYNYQLKSIPNLFQLNEYESSKAKANLAYQYIINNPKHETVLFIRKLAIFFLPYNYLNNHFDVILFLSYFGFILYSIYLFVAFKTEIQNDARIICFLFVLGIIAVNVIFFVEYRIRYLADPIMLILGSWIVIKLFRQLPFLKKY